ncbi:MAG: agmatine deiminase family protein [Microscillaceae bacterium]|jgi:agmatine deiminase|nr:agmatine deiminase family protein [Microscillaceae bacterium]
MNFLANTPAELGYYFPAEWHEHQSTWLSFPHNPHTWAGEKLSNMLPAYFEFIKTLAEVELVNINVLDEKMKNFVEDELAKISTNLHQVVCHLHPSNDSWCRDHGPAFLLNPQAETKKVIVDWEYNAWGGKYPPYDADNQIPSRIAQVLNLPVFRPQIVMEGGSVDFNGQGTVLTTRDCLLNPNRNPHLSQVQIEDYLKKYYGVQQVLWLGEGIVGDDTDGHVDDITRFVNEDTVLTAVEPNRQDANYHPLQENLKALQNMQLLNGKSLNIIELPMPAPHYLEGERMPASYANFYIANQRVIVPTFRCTQDDIALDIIQKCFPAYRVVGIDAFHIIWGLGSFHCLSQQEPKAN